METPAIIVCDICHVSLDDLAGFLAEHGLRLVRPLTWYWGQGPTMRAVGIGELCVKHQSNPPESP